MCCMPDGTLKVTYPLKMTIVTLCQIRRGKRNSLGIIFHTTLSNICCDPSLEPSHRDGSNEGSQHMLSLRNKKKYL